MPEITEALGAPQTIAFSGRDFAVKPLTFRDLASIEDKYGSLDALDLTRVSTQVYILSLALRKTDPSLTEDAVGDMLTLDKAQEVGEFVLAVLTRSGLVSKPEAARAEADAGNAEAGQENGEN